MVSYKFHRLLMCVFWSFLSKKMVENCTFFGLLQTVLLRSHHIRESWHVTHQTKELAFFYKMMTSSMQTPLNLARSSLKRELALGPEIKVAAPKS